MKITTGITKGNKGFKLYLYPALTIEWWIPILTISICILIWEINLLMLLNYKKKS